MKFLSLNVALFEKNNKQLANFLSEQKPDILCLQEVTRRVDKSADADLISKDGIDASLPDLADSFYSPTWILSKFEKRNFHGQELFSRDFGGKLEFGTYIKSKFEISKAQNIFVLNHFTYSTDTSNWPEEDYRAVQVSDLNVKGSKLRVLNYHGIWTQDKLGTDRTKRACEIIRDLALEVNYPTIICGDFNLFPDTDSMNVLNKHFVNLGDIYNIKTTRPESNELSNQSRNVVDYIFVSKDIKVKSFEVQNTNVSDHLPLILEFELE